VSLSDDQLRTALAALDARGGKLLTRAFAAQAGVPPHRLRGHLSSLRRLLNVEGYAVLGEEEGTVVLDRELLKVQFGLEGA